MTMYSAIALALSYLLGSIPTGLWLGLALKGVDIREHGSKNIGATNTLRVLGKGLGALALAGDVGKGLLAVLLASKTAAALGGEPWQYAPLACGIAAIFGHTFSVFCGFKGGKGVATSTGVFLALTPIPTLIAIGVFILVVSITRMVSAGSCIGAVVFAVTIFPFSTDWVLRVVVLILAALIVIRHRTNIQRILKGEENRLGSNSTEPEHG